MSTTLLRLSSIPIALAAGPRADGDPWVRAHLTGVVRDDAGRPIPGVTVWWRDQYGISPPHPGAAGRTTFGRGLTDADGRYRLDFHAELGKPLEGLRISAHARGFARADVEFRSDNPLARAEESGTLDIRLSRGDVLAGVARMPPRPGDRPAGRAPGRRAYFVRVRGPGFSQVHRTEPGGRFEIWVPRGRYTLELMSDGIGSLAALEDVASGTRDLELPKREEPLDRDVLARAYDALWDDLDRNYSYFELKGIDREALRRKYRPRAVDSGSLPAFVDVLGEMLGELDDGHVWFVEPEGAVVAYRPRPRRSNLNVEATEAALEGAAGVGNGFARVGTIRPEGFGVIRIVRQSRADAGAVARVVAFIRDHADAPGFLVDLRTADGGNELLARQIAREFAARDTVYARSKYRDGPRPTDFGPVYDRVLEASERPFTKPVVCVLGPGCVSSGEGFAEMMACLPHVTTVGLPTRGSSGNPKPSTLPGVPVTVMYSRWVDLRPDGTPVEGRGVPPEILVDRPEAAYERADPTWERAVEVLREKVRAAR